MIEKIYDLAEIKKLASQSIEKGALTKDYALDLKQAHRLLNEALATEVVCVLRYRHHAITVKGIDYHPVQQEFIEHAQQEEQHMLMIAERINQLDGNPEFDLKDVLKNSATEFTYDDTLEDMIKTDLIAERVAIMVYHKLITWFGDKDPTTRIMLEHILKQEEDHANDLADFLHSNK
ncbi:MAG: ferritin-like domain-containing protein [Gammaproteobacteria bacterium]